MFPRGKSRGIELLPGAVFRCFNLVFFVVFLMFPVAGVYASDNEKVTETTDSLNLEELSEYEEYTTHYVSVHGEFGQGWMIGGGYSVAAESLGPHGASWLAMGPNINLARRRHGEFGVLTLCTFRGGVTGHGGGFSGEMIAGVGTSIDEGPVYENSVLVGGGGLFYSLQEVEIGYSFRFFLGESGRPSWLGSHYLSIRVYSPFHSRKK